MSMFSMQSSKPAPLRDRRLERIEVHDEEIDRRDAMREHRRLVLRVLADRQQAAVNLRVQRLDPPVHHLGKAGEIGDIADREARRRRALCACRRSRRARRRALRAPRAKSTRPVLSETEISARAMERSLSGISVPETKTAALARVRVSRHGRACPDSGCFRARSNQHLPVPPDDLCRDHLPGRNIANPHLGEIFRPRHAAGSAQ